MVQSGEMSLEDFVARQSAWMGKLVERCQGYAHDHQRAGSRGARLEEEAA